MSDFVVFNNYGSITEAEIHAEILRAEDIAVILQGPQSGMFGAGFAGTTVQGVTLLVPTEDLDRALELIDLPEAE
jgi:hypothetical protein